MCVWRVPGEMVEKDNFYIGLNSGYEFNIENMKEFDITEQLKLSMINKNVLRKKKDQIFL